ncbi:MAG: STAS domain-containing protein [bacterium]|nr:STAS domain-containing protein [bacterium]
MEILIKRVNNVAIVYFSGKLDTLFSTDADRNIISAIFEKPDIHLLLNFEQVESISSLGVRLMVSLMNGAVSEGREFKICSINGTIKSVLDIVDLIDESKVYNSEEEALDSFPGA